ncbi:hypothetical protein MFU01_78610 [Myxococcus fulvus]|uniref:Lipoprotein n=1 Tax=Myxococcus fulvus TaxID=33 RepID=A0A511TF80_MYXFU|nr:hypothetical protein [Myxococcus fulvus]GEN12824.1 hypothetical protein MFU01_78610 [Myxococcus fulvus]
MKRCHIGGVVLAVSLAACGEPSRERGASGALDSNKASLLPPGDPLIGSYYLTVGPAYTMAIFADGTGEITGLSPLDTCRSVGDPLYRNITLVTSTPEWSVYEGEHYEECGVPSPGWQPTIIQLGCNSATSFCGLSENDGHGLDWVFYQF